jgi:2-methylcitrate dehydratase PrpD
MQKVAEPLKYSLADAILGLTYDTLDRRTIQKAKDIFLYHSWLCFFALQEKDPEIALGFFVVRNLGMSQGSCTVIGNTLKVQPLDAAYLNCHLVRGVGYDDVVFPAGMHTGLVVIPVAMALAQQLRRSGKDFLTALVVGYEVMAKVGRWSWSSDSPRRPSTIFGPLAAAASAVPLLRLGREQTAEAIGYAMHSAQGLAANLCTHMYGTFCRAGILSALYAQAGGTCAPDIVEGELGFYRAFFNEAPSSSGELLGDFGRNFGVFHSREKRYPGTMLNMVAIELLRGLIHTHALNAHNVESVSVALSNRRSRHPTAQLRPPYKSRAEAASSLPYQVAMLLLDGDIKLERYEVLNDPEVLSLANKVGITFVDQSHPLYARVTLRRTDGEIFEARGEDHVFPPLDAKHQLQKYASDVLSEKRIERFCELVARLEELDNLSEMLDCLTPGP